jgi:hypothetical protein
MKHNTSETSTTHLAGARRALHQRHRAGEHGVDGLGLGALQARSPQERLHGEGDGLVRDDGAQGLAVHGAECGGVRGEAGDVQRPGLAGDAKRGQFMCRQTEAGCESERERESIACERERA